MVTIVDIAEAAQRIGSVRSPSFTMSSAHILGGDLVPDEWRHRQQEISGRTFPEVDVAVYMVENAIVDGAGLVYDGQLNLIQQSIHQTSPDEVDAFTYSVVEHSRRGAIPFHAGTTVLCEKSGVGNYGHWLVEMLPVVFAFLDQLTSCESFVRMPQGSSRMNAIMFDSMSLLGVPVSQIRLRRPGPERYERLYMLPGLSHHGHRYSPLAINALNRLATDVEAGPREKIWVTRHDAARRLAHEAELCEALRSLGWMIAEPGKMRLQHQIGLFKNAERVAGVAGAGLTNIAFAPTGTPVTLFMPAVMPDIFYWSLASFKSQPYSEIRCASLPGTAGESWSGLLDIPVEEVVRLVMG